MKILVLKSHASIAAGERVGVALNSAELPEGCELVALNFELPADGSAPEWIELLPAGLTIQGRDGRAWLNDRPEGVIEAFRLDGRELPFDWEHSTELKAPKGEEAPASGWASQLEAREGGSIWAKVAWTPKGRASIEGREYRYISPVFVFEKDSGRVLRLTSAALTNQPNLRLSALNRQQPTKEKRTMELAQLLALLGLPAGTTLEQALNHIRKMQGDLQTALNSVNSPSLDKFVPRADFDQMKTRALNAEQAAAEQKKAEQEIAINSEIDGALKAGKIAPASKDYYVAMCRKEGGLDAFRDFLKTAPEIGKPSGMDTRTPPAAGVALNAEEKQICASLGISEEEYRKANA